MAHKKNLYIIGAGDSGRELESWLDDVPAGARDWELRGFLHNGPNLLDKYPSDLRVVGDWMTFPYSGNDIVVLGISDIKYKTQVYECIGNKVKLLKFVHPTVKIAKFTTIGEGSVIMPNCIISTNVKIGKCVFINIGSKIGHDVKIGDFSSIMSNVDFGGHVCLEKNVFVGTKATIMPGKTVVADTVIGTGSMVIADITKAQTVFGNPARGIAPRK